MSFDGGGGGRVAPSDELAGNVIMPTLLEDFRRAAIYPLARLSPGRILPVVQAWRHSCVRGLPRALEGFSNQAGWKTIPFLAGTSHAE